MKLEKQHQVKLEEIIDSYKDIHESIEEKKTEMQSLQNEIKLLLKKLDANRHKEIEFGQELEKHYGKGVFNIKTGEYELVN
jgi:seryl-tRNA synthetase